MQKYNELETLHEKLWKSFASPDVFYRKCWRDKVIDKKMNLWVLSFDNRFGMFLSNSSVLCFHHNFSDELHFILFDVLITSWYRYNFLFFYQFLVRRCFCNGWSVLLANFIFCFVIFDKVKWFFRSVTCFVWVIMFNELSVSLYSVSSVSVISLTSCYLRCSSLQTSMNCPLVQLGHVDP